MDKHQMSQYRILWRHHCEPLDNYLSEIFYRNSQIWII